MPKVRRALAVVAVGFLLATPAHRAPPSGPGDPSEARLTARPVALYPDAPARRDLGPLHFVEGWVLDSDDGRFGGISGLAVDGDHLLALSDQGTLLRFRPPPGDGRVAIHPLLEGPGTAGSKIDRDSESLALHGDRLWIGYENSNQFWRYRTGSWAAESRAAPSQMRRWSANRGAEALIRLVDGRFLTIREDVDDEGVSDALLFAGDPAEADTFAIPLRIDPPEGYRVTDGAALPDGRLLLVARSFGMWKGWTARLLLAELRDTPDALMPVRELAALESPLTRDNMEALAVTREGDRIIVWLASDDNLMPLQRTLLLKFEWRG